MRELNYEAAPPLIRQILDHRDDTAVASKATELQADDQPLFPIVVAFARLVAKAEAAGTKPTPRVVEPD